MYKKVSGWCLSPAGVELGAPKIGMFQRFILYWNRKVDSFSGWTLPKLLIISKNCSNKSCWKLNFVQKITGRTCLPPPRVELGGSKDWYVSEMWSVLGNHGLGWNQSILILVRNRQVLIYNKSNKPAMKSLTHVGSEKSLIELGSSKKWAFSLYHICHCTEKFTFHPEPWAV